MRRTISAYEQLSVEWKALQSAWENTQHGWNDDVADQFKKRFFAHYEAEVPQLLTRLNELANEIKQARRELR